MCTTVVVRQLTSCFHSESTILCILKVITWSIITCFDSILVISQVSIYIHTPLQKMKASSCLYLVPNILLLALPSRAPPWCSTVWCIPHCSWGARHPSWEDWSIHYQFQTSEDSVVGTLVLYMFSLSNPTSFQWVTICTMMCSFD